MKTNILNIIIILFLFGCNSSKQKQAKIELPNPPPPPIGIEPTSSPPAFIPNISEIKELQINRLPHPFNLDGALPFAVWADGERLSLNGKQAKELASYLGIEFTQPPNTAEIHNGQGWIYPYPTKQNKIQANKPPFFNKTIR